MPTVPQNVIDEHYQLRSTFFLGKLQELGFFGLFSTVESYATDHGHTCSWESLEDLGILTDAWKRITDAQIPPLLLFAHPVVLRAQPSLLRYYRSVSLLSQKGLSKLAPLGDVDGVESGRREISEAKLAGVVRAVNKTMSVLVTLAEELERERLKGMMFASAGTTIQGSWGNAVGTEGERVIRSIILKGLVEAGEVTGFIHTDGASSTIDDWRDRDPAAKVTHFRSVSMTNGYTMVFRSEPDIEISNPDGAIIGAIEIKAGIDPAGALERLGASFKSFDSVLGEYPNAETILIVSCLTDEVESRIRQASSVKRTFILTEIITNEATKRRLVNAVRALLGLISRRL
jgi:hypothetical protein